ncbi:MAG TPA: double-strand break repair protein AddB [Paracoccaceae bacterium]|nr:double-strand break repair protein AddB [Paracoccaceae bacterium]
MFAEPGPRIFALTPGADFARAFAAGLRARAARLAPEGVARIEILTHARRAAAALNLALAEAFGPDALLPTVGLVTEVAERPDAPALPPAVSALRRRLRLSELVRAFLMRREGLAPLSARFDLAASLASFLDEMQGAAIAPSRLAELDLGEHAAHWQATRDFLGIIASAWPEILAESEVGALDPEARQRRAVEALALRWQAAPPGHPVIVAGSTGSRPATALLMEAVAGLPQGALVLPGLDRHLPAGIWEALGPDHPQAAIAGVLRRLGREAPALPLWHGEEARPAWNRLLSLALRPAPVTDAWLDAVPELRPGLAGATAHVSLIEAESPREEALAIALAMREALERPGQRVALVTPDRVLARQVTAALARWEIRPDDAAGRPLSLTPPGIFLRQVARLAGGAPAADAFVALLKHPLCGGEGARRRDHMLLVSVLEAALRREALPHVGTAWLRRWAEGLPEGSLGWVEWLAASLEGLDAAGELPIEARAAALRQAAERLSAGPGGDAPRLWRRADGEAALALLAGLEAEAATGATLGPGELARLLESLMEGINVPPSDPGEAPDARVLILGNREARIETADRVILGGLNDGVWPALPGADPWLSRPMRAALGLAMPERQVGLAAHDFQTAAGAAELILSRARRLGGATAIASRWLIRLGNLLEGAGEEGKAALEAMRARGAEWLGLARALDRPEAPLPPAMRPAPRPPVVARPRRLPVTRIGTLIRDPYAIYAEFVLGLLPLDPLGRLRDARDRGRALHAVLERFLVETQAGLPGDARALLDRIAAEEIDRATPWAAERRLWRGRLARAADWFLEGEARRRAEGVALQVEGGGRLEFGLPAGPFTLTAKADRIDRLADGTLAILDYKTGSPPTPAQERAFDRQLWLEAAIAEAGGFRGVPAAPVSRMAYLGLTGGREGGKERRIEPGAGEVAQAFGRFVGVMARYDDPATAYVSRLRPAFLRYDGPYDHLARRLEWEDAEEAEE